jgi:hypothetical protein
MPDKFTISQFKQLIAFDTRLEMNWNKVIQITFNIPLEIVAQIPDDTKELAISFIAAYIMQVRTDYVSNKMNLENLTFGQYIDLDVYYSDGLHQHLEKVINILFNIDEDDYINEYWGGVLYYIKWRQNFIKNYQNLFSIDDEQEMPTKSEAPNQVARSWYNTAMYLIEDDLLKLESLLNQPVVSVFNFMAYKKQKNLDELSRSRKQN